MTKLSIRFQTISNVCPDRFGEYICHGKHCSVKPTQVYSVYLTVINHLFAYTFHHAIAKFLSGRCYQKPLFRMQPFHGLSLQAPYISVQFYHISFHFITVWHNNSMYREFPFNIIGFITSVGLFDGHMCLLWSIPGRWLTLRDVYFLRLRGQLPRLWAMALRSTGNPVQNIWRIHTFARVTNRPSKKCVIHVALV